MGQSIEYQKTDDRSGLHQLAGTAGTGSRHERRRADAWFFWPRFYRTPNQELKASLQNSLFQMECSLRENKKLVATVTPLLFTLSRINQSAQIRVK